MWVGLRYEFRSSQLTPPMAGYEAPAALYLFMSVARASHAVAMLRMSAIVRFCFARCMAVNRLGIAMAARMPMIATTISSSIRVRSEEHTSELQSPDHLVCRLLLDKISRSAK